MSFSRTASGIAARYLFDYARDYTDISYRIIRQDPLLKKKPKLDWSGGLKELRDQYTSVELQKKALEWRD